MPEIFNLFEITVPEEFWKISVATRNTLKVSRINGVRGVNTDGVASDGFRPVQAKPLVDGSFHCPQ